MTHFIPPPKDKKKKDKDDDGSEDDDVSAFHEEFSLWANRYCKKRDRMGYLKTPAGFAAPSIFHELQHLGT